VRVENYAQIDLQIQKKTTILKWKKYFLGDRM